MTKFDTLWAMHLWGIIGEGERLVPLLEALEGRRDAASISGVVTQHSPVVFPSPWSNGIVRKFDPQLPHLGYYIAQMPSLS